MHALKQLLAEAFLKQLRMPIKERPSSGSIVELETPGVAAESGIAWVIFPRST